VIIVREFAPQDAQGVIQAFRTAIREVACRDYSPEQIEAWAQPYVELDGWVTRYSARQTWVAVNGDVVGFADLEPGGHLDNLYVHSEHQRRGVASALLTRVETAAREEGIFLLHTEASITAKPFFERRGFKLMAPQNVDFGGQRFRNFRMEKRL
jgi:putative acetyltransferase